MRERIYVQENFLPGGRSLPVPGGTRPWLLFYTLTTGLAALDSTRFVMLKEFTLSGYLGDLAPVTYCNKNQDFNLPSKDKKWFQENQGDELLSIQFIRLSSILTSSSFKQYCRKSDW